MKRFIRFLAILFVFTIGQSLLVMAQQLQRPVAASAYIYNFAKNVEWKNEAQLKEFNFLIIGQDEKIIQEMRNMAKSKNIREKPIRITTATALTDVNSVQLIFLLKGKEENLVKVFDQIEGKNILLVTDGYQDKKMIMINFFDSEKGTLQFEINKANILNQNLRIMQDMILIGGTEIDVAALYREGQQSLRTLQKHSDDLEKKMNQLEVSIKQLEKTIVLRNKELQDSKDSLKRQSARIQEQQKILNNQSIELKQREKELAEQILKIQEQQRISVIQTKNLESQKAEFEKGNKILQEQKEDINKQKAEIDTQSLILEEQGLKIHKQQNLVYLLVIIVVLVIILVVAIYKGYKNKRKLNLQLENKVAERTLDLETSYKQLMNELSERKQAEKKLVESENKYRTLLENIPQKIFFKNNELFFVSCNENFARELKIVAADIEGKTDFDFFSKEFAEKYRKEDLDFLASGEPLETEICEARDGKTCWTQVVKIPVKDELGEIIGVQGIFWDITDRKQAEEKIKKSNRIFAFISEVNQMIVRLKDKEEVLKNVCRIAIEYGHFQMAWIGFVDKKTKLINPVFFSGIEDGYLSIIPMISMDEEPTGQGPTGKALKVGNHFVCNEIQNDPIMAPWRDEALKRNYYSSIAIPIKMFGEVIGAFSLYAKTPFFFDSEETKFLIEVVDDIRFALESIETEQKRVRAEDELKHHKDNLELLISERTAELETKNMELARMNKMFVGREIRMAELKTRIAELENKNDYV